MENSGALVFATVIALSAGCAHGPLTATGPDHAPAHEGAHASPSPGVTARHEASTVRIAPDPRGGTLAVRISSWSTAPRVWTIADARSVRLTDVSVRDARGELPVETAWVKEALVLRVAGTPVAPVELRYVIAGEASNARSDFAACRVIVEPDRASFCGEQVIALPDAADRTLPIRLTLVPDGDLHHDAASSFGLDDDALLEIPHDDLRHGAFVFGKLGSAEFHAAEGRDHAAWLGFASFDPRWVAAEAAGVRTAVDRALGIGRQDDEPSSGMIIVGGSHAEHPIQIQRRARGVVISADVSAPWSGEARVRVAQIFAQRLVGGALWIGNRSLEEEASGFWFSEGVSRAVALFVLADLGVLGRDEIAGAVNALLAEEALSELRDRTLVELAGDARHPDDEIREPAMRALAVRGALVGLRIGPGHLSRVLRASLERAVSNGTNELPLDTFLEIVASEAGAETARDVTHALQRGGAIGLPRNAAGACHDLVRRSVARYELGFSVVQGVARTISIVEPRSSAERAGLRAGDRIESLEYVPGRSDVPVTMSIERVGKMLPFRFLPAGAAKPGRAFVRVSGGPLECNAP